MSARTRIKFCGLTRAEDVDFAVDLGADFIGLVFAARSPRRLDLAQARALRARIPAQIGAVALVMDQTGDEVRAILDQVQPNVLQFHGEEDATFCASFGHPYWKVVAMGGDVAADAWSRHSDAAAFLLDSHVRGGAGGTGRTFDWSRIPSSLDRPFLLAGGIGPDNVFDAIEAVHPWGVDVSSGIEAAPGEKDAAKMRRFVEEVRRADHQGRHPREGGDPCISDD
ncbi:phosphoribosylanthranilate isomerase [Lysobacter sp.]|uniref:phosphoribosylanthranilate isomerase n=1 Tax=Lysobacter sp. TaxID=72226 RepID=UPI002D451806|nr:phosphoribosylanthranilate isomerase [Lysobacter sp.]HZX78892.1 phosphoribosylanthranilate isomerase [Lysobacter sp.]